MAGSALWWWPTIMDPNLELPWWLPFGFVVLGTGLSTSLSRGRWKRFVLASSVGTFAGFCLGLAIWPASDPFAWDFIPLVVPALTAITVLLSLVIGFALRKVSITNERSRRVAWLLLFTFAAFGPIAVALTPPLVARRISRNDRIAAERFKSLKDAVERTAAEADGAERICDGSSIRQHYSGPPFSAEDWDRIAGNSVKQDGHFFMVHCREEGGYTIRASPDTFNAYGTHHFCTDESRRVGCTVEWNRSRHVCLPCTK